MAKFDILGIWGKSTRDSENIILGTWGLDQGLHWFHSYSSLNHIILEKNSIPSPAGSTVPELPRFSHPPKGSHFEYPTLFGSAIRKLNLSLTEQLLVAGLPYILLIRASIESNPGPEEFFCCICGVNPMGKKTLNSFKISYFKYDIAPIIHILTYINALRSAGNITWFG